MISFRTVVEGAGLADGRPKSPGYPVAIGCYDGDWWTAAKVYRAWAVRQQWCRKGKMVTRADYPKRMAETHLWSLFGAMSEPASSNFINQITAVWPDVKQGIEFTFWSFPPHDTSYPELYPARFHFKGLVAQAEGKGVMTMPYTNGKLYSVDLLSYGLWAKDGIILDRDGSEAFEKWQRGRCEFRIMCPSDPRWQAVMKASPRMMQEKYHTGAIYIDQIGAGPGRACFNPKHGHAPGGGTFWAEGHRVILESVHREYEKAGAPITSECLCEDYIDVIDGQLCPQEPAPEDIPLFAALYSGYTTVFGNRIDDTTISTNAFFALEARSVLWGIAPGWCDHWYFTGKTRNLAIVKELGKCGRARQHFAAYLAWGTLEGEAMVAGENPVVDIRWKNARTIRNQDRLWRTPAVFGNLWRLADEKKTAAVLANVDTVPHAVRVRVGGEWRDVTVGALDFALVEER